MGTDIHIRVYTKNEHPDGHISWEWVEGPRHHHVGWDACASWYNGRNYELFGVLARVRREDAQVIAPPRGLPPWMTEEEAKDEKKEWLGEHDFTHFTLAELLKAKQLKGEQRLSGYVDLPTYKRWVEKGRKGCPDSWYQWGGGRKVSNKEADALIQGEEPDWRTATWCEWKIQRKDWFSAFTNFLKFLSTYTWTKPEDVVIVIGFDS